MIASDFTTVLPEVLLSLYAMLALVVFVYTGKDRHAVLSIW
jgi:NADH-quinone oxidoreductase subunit N